MKIWQGFIEGLKKIKRNLAAVVKNARASLYLKKNKFKVPTNEIIKVGFYIDFPQGWDKLSPIYKCMKENEFFFPQVIVDKKTGHEQIKALEHVDFSETGEVIFNDGLLNIKELEYDYFFYQRPYNSFYPSELNVSKVVKYTNICYLPYGYAGSDVFNSGNTNSEFFRYVYLGFIEIGEERRILNEKFKVNCQKGYQYFENHGYPAFEKYLDYKSSGIYSHILWTPRWALGEIGGSHFLEYKDEFLKLNEVFPNAQITFRPHPLMFGNFISKGLMTKNEVEEYKNKMLSNGIMQSSNDSVEDDFDSTDILLTDYSSIMIQYFLTGKPIVYCPAEYELNEEYKRILDGVYVANSWQDAVDIMKKLLDGKDILKEKREAIIKQYFTDVKGSSKRIVTRIYDDYMERKNLFRR
ncbi:MAG: CDP-glycerol glycerophosphotransferase family protein [Lachnospiraceae bacterium]|nr:CDP-glycerol glycerophosphotransferase family protein [Lachnospiraceae bacterium]